MSFPILSTSVITAVIKRTGRVMQRSQAAALIDHGGVYNCRKIGGSTSWSQHSWGNAIDLFPEAAAGIANSVCRHIAAAVVTQSTKRTLANRGRRLKIYRVIDHANSLQWIRGYGWKEYTGTVGPHVHAEGPNKTGTPPCAR